MYRPRVIALEEIHTGIDPQDIFEKTAKELSIIKKRISIIDQLVVRAGFVLDNLMGNKPNDFDIFYSLKNWKYRDWPGCECTLIKRGISELDLPIINSQKVDLGHILKGEIYFSPVEKIVGPFSHHIDIPGMVCLDDQGQLWGNDEALNCINNKICEIRFDGWLQHAYHPYIENSIHNKLPVFYLVQVFRELRMIYSKKYKKVGPNLELLLEMALPAFDYVLNDQELTEYVKKNVAEKNFLMRLPDYQKALDLFSLKNPSLYLERVKLFIPFAG